MSFGCSRIYSVPGFDCPQGSALDSPWAGTKPLRQHVVTPLESAEHMILVVVVRLSMPAHHFHLACHLRSLAAVTASLGQLPPQEPRCRSTLTRDQHQAQVSNPMLLCLEQR